MHRSDVHRKPGTPGSSEIFVTTLAVGAGIALVIWAMRLVGVGLDFSDDGYYLNVNREPELYRYSVTQFGFIYNQLFRAVDWDVVLFRQAGFAITVFLSFCLVGLRLKGLGLSWLQSLAVACILAPLCLALFHMWLPTPGYNSMGFQGLLLVGIALTILDANGRASLIGWALLGVGGWVVFLAKPTSAAALGPLVLAYLVAMRGWRLYGVAISVIVAVGLLLFSALAIDGSVEGFITRLAKGAEVTASLEGGHTLTGILRLDLFTLSLVEVLTLIGNIGLIALATAWIASQRTHLRQLGFGVPLAYALVTLAVAFGIAVPPFGFGSSYIMQIWAAPIGAILGMLVRDRRAFWPSRCIRLTAALFAVFPHVLSFGTNNNYWINGAMAGLFWVLAGLILVLGSGAVARWRDALPGAVGALGIIAVLMAATTQHPYRQTQPLAMQHTDVAIGRGGHALPMSADFAAYIEGLRTLATEAGFVAGTPMIDLTGHYPGALFALDAQAIGQAWMIGGYHGSSEMSRSALQQVPCAQIAAAWLLREPEGERALSAEIVLPAGLDYEDVGGILSPMGTYPQAYQQWLSRPIGSMEERQSACEAGR